MKPNTIRFILFVLPLLFLSPLITNKSDTAAQEAENITYVKTEKPRQVTIVSEKSYQGVLRPRVEAKVYANISAKIVSLNVEAGQTVAEAKVTQAKANLITTQKLVEAKVWEREIAIAKSAASEAEEQLKLAREQVNQAAILSPINGIVAERHLETGDYAKSAASQGQPVYTIVAVDILKAVWKVPVSEISRIQIGNMVLISTASGIQNIIGTIDFISPTVKERENAATVHATLQNLKNTEPNNTPTTSKQNDALKPGTSITISIKTSERKNVTLLPQRAVLQIQNGKGNIFVVEQNRIRLKQVNIGGVYGSEIETQTKISQSVQIIVENQHLLKDGMSGSVVKD